MATTHPWRFDRIARRLGRKERPFPFHCCGEAHSGEFVVDVDPEVESLGERFRVLDGPLGGLGFESA